MDSFKQYFCHGWKREFRLSTSTEARWKYCRSYFWEELEYNSSEDEDHPSNFKPFEIKEPEVTETPVVQRTNSKPTVTLSNLMQTSDTGRAQRVYRIEQNLGTTDMSGMFSNLSGLLSGIIGEQLANQVAEQSMGNIIHQVMQTDIPTTSTNPASKDAVDRLKRGSYKDLLKSLDFKDMKIVSRDKEQINLQETILKNSANKQCSVWKDEFTDAQKDLIRMPCLHIFHETCLIPWLEKNNSWPTWRHELPKDEQKSECSTPYTQQQVFTTNFSSSGPTIITNQTFSFSNLRNR